MTTDAPLSAPAAAGSARNRRGGSGPRLVRTATLGAIREARDSGRMKPADDPLALLAVVVAGQVDAASKSDRAAEVVRLSKELRDLLHALPLRAEETPRDDAGDSTAGADPFDAELEALMGSAPTVGDTQVA